VIECLRHDPIQTLKGRYVDQQEPRRGDHAESVSAFPQTALSPAAGGLWHRASLPAALIYPTPIAC
jgi:hypothetical protein